MTVSCSPTILPPSELFEWMWRMGFCMCNVCGPVLPQARTTTGLFTRLWTSAGSCCEFSPRRCWRGFLRAPWLSSTPENLPLATKARSGPPLSSPPFCFFLSFPFSSPTIFHPRGLDSLCRQAAAHLVSSFTFRLQVNSVRKSPPPSAPPPSPYPHSGRGQTFPTCGCTVVYLYSPVKSGKCWWFWYLFLSANSWTYHSSLRSVLIYYNLLSINTRWLQKQTR